MSDLEARIGELFDSDLSALSVDDIVELLRPYMKGHKIKAPQFASGMRLFRARVVDHATSISGLTYPPPELTRVGRANREGRPMFYASNARAAAFFEVDPPVGSHVLVSRWKTTAPLLATHLGYHPDVFNTLSSARKVASWDGKNDPLEGKNQHRETWNAFAKLFTAKDHPEKYKLSAAVTSCMLGGPMAGLLYPSIAMSANADNFALLPEWVDANLQFVGVEKVLIKERAGTNIEATDVDYATSPDSSSLEWKGRGPVWVLRENGVEASAIAENGIWVLRDKNGVEIDPE